MVLLSSDVCFATPVSVTTRLLTYQLPSQLTSTSTSTTRRLRCRTRRLPGSNRQSPRLSASAGASLSSSNVNGATASSTSSTNTTASPPPTVPSEEQLRENTPVLSARVANTALRTLLRYFLDLSERQPFIRRRLALSVLCIVISKLIGLSVPFFLKRAIDALMSFNNPASPTSAAVASAAAVTAILLHGAARIASSLTHELRNAIFAKGGQRIGRSVTASTFAHLHSLELGFHTGSRTGAVTRVIDRGTRSIMTIFRAIIFSFFPSFFELLLVCAVLFSNFSFTYVIVTLLTFAAFTAWTLSVNTTMGQVRAHMNAVENESSAKLTDSLINVEAVKVYNNAAHETHRYDQALQAFETIAIRSEKLYAKLNIGQTAAYTVGLTVLLLLATADIFAGRISVGSVVLLTTMLQRLWIPLDFLGWQYREVRQSLIDVQNLFDILKRQPAIQEVENATSMVVTGGQIDFDNVSFVYPEGDAVIPFSSKKGRNGVAKTNVIENGNGNGLPKKSRRRVAIDGLTFSVPSGSSVALVGESGSGKTSATRLLCRLYDVTSGRILIDGQDIAQASLYSLQQAVSIVPQDTALFNDTIEYNIRYGRPSATDEEVVEAAKAASIHQVIMRTENGYKTLVGERGVRLSGGERQRLSVARAFLKGSRIIVEDESTSALDTLTEMEVSRALRRLGKNRTRIIVAHRLSTIMNVDQVIVMKGGKMVEQGSFNELVNRRGGTFKDMWERQQRRSEEEEEEEGMVDVGNINGKVDEHMQPEEEWQVDEQLRQMGP